MANGATPQMRWAKGGTVENSFSTEYMNALSKLRKDYVNFAMGRQNLEPIVECDSVERLKFYSFIFFFSFFSLCFFRLMLEHFCRVVLTSVDPFILSLI